MQEVVVVLIVIAVAALAVVAGYYANKAEKARRASLAALAAELGLSFDTSRREPTRDYKRFGVFNQGHSRCVFNTMSGEVTLIDLPFPVAMGDYEYKITSSNGKTTTTTTYRFSYVLLRIPMDVPDLLIRPEGFLDRIAGAIGFDDIDFESDEFSRAYHVKSPDKRFAYDVIDPRMMEYLLTGPRRVITIEGGVMLIHESMRRWEAADFRAKLGFANAFFERWPEHVVRARTLVQGRNAL